MPGISFEKSRLAVRFGTKKIIGFPRLAVIFDGAATLIWCSNGGAHSHILVGLAEC
jgi:hypothetical protein